MDRTIASRRYFRFWRASRQIGVRTAVISVVAVAAASIAPYMAPLVPEGLADIVTVDAVTRLLQILASSMLAVTIFSLSVIISARTSASAQVTPRSHQVLIEDRVTQNVLAMFLGAFIFSLVDVIFLGTGLFDGATVTVILGLTLVVIALVIWAILRWITHIAELGSVTATSRKIEAAALAALDARRALPCLGARPLTAGHLEVPARAASFTAWDTGYIQHIDLKTLSSAARSGDGNVYVAVQPGELVSPGDTLVYYTAELDEARLRRAFTIADRRVFEQDPRFGVIVLSEIAQRALSPGVNDPGTAIDILTRLARVLSDYRDETSSEKEPLLPRIWMASVTADELVRDAFDPIARDGAGTVEVQIRLQKTLALLASSGDETMARAARAASDRALRLAQPALALEEHRARVTELAERV
ncbi:DUF2254 domain-containing protein [Candidatus Rhodobacter oscarellae]|nr:DUF2254 domain-containing protein [Candidatus Rhodobacter lobularis]